MVWADIVTDKNKTSVVTQRRGQTSGGGIPSNASVLVMHEDVGALPAGDVKEILDALAWNCPYGAATPLVCYNWDKRECQRLWAKALSMRFPITENDVCICACHEKRD